MTRVDVIARELLLDDKHYWRCLGEFWEDRPTLLVFLRHFGSAFAYDQADVLAESLADLRAANVTTVMVGIGTPRDAAHFRTSTRTQLPVLVDPALTIYRRLGLRQASSASLKPADIAGWVRSEHTRAAFASREHRRQLGGSLLIDRGGKVLDEQRANRIGEITRYTDIGRYLQKLATRGTPLGDARHSRVDH